MIEIIILILAPIVGIVMFCLARAILVEGTKEEVEFPLASCDTSMYDEIKPEQKKENN